MNELTLDVKLAYNRCTCRG